jgi:phosphate starvation-inducible protein PhoH
MSKKKKRYTQEQQQQEQRSERSFNQYIKERKTVNLIPKSLNQEHYIDLLTNQTKNIVFATGPAGTGKTFLAMLAGIKAYKEHQVSKIILTRPAVGVDEARFPTRQYKR